MWSKARTSSSLPSSSDTAVDQEMGGPEPSECADLNGKASWRQSASNWCHAAKAHPIIPLFSIMLFGVIFGSGVAVVQVVRHSDQQGLIDEAQALAIETGDWFSKQLDLAILPLFSLAQFAIEMEIFRGLPSAIGPGDESGSLPYITDTVITHRNVTGICDDPDIVKRYTEISGTIKRNAQMQGILINLELAPQGVVCLVDPLNNTEDFPDGIFYDSSTAVGHDLLKDPLRKEAAEATIIANKAVVTGPLMLRRCNECHPLIEQAFIVRLPIDVPDHTIEVQGVSHNCWGFAVAVINWKELVRRSNIYDNFRLARFQFRLKQVDLVFDNATNIVKKNNVILAETEDFDRDTSSWGRGVVTTQLETSYNEWVMTVAYQVDEAKFAVIIGIAFFVALSVTGLIGTIMIQKQIHADALTATSAELVDQARLAAKREHELNDYIAHEVRNPLAAAISACTFVSSSLSEKQPLTDEASRIAVCEDVAIIEVSLRYINDLLRSMLDLSRAASNQLVLEHAPVDILNDILNPVAAMLYSRDQLFEVLVECPSNLIVEADRLRLKQVVLNLGRNAVKFVIEGFVRLRAAVVDGSVHLYIEDSGPGIPHEKRKNLFCKFQDSLDVLSQGTGIGLSLCDQLIQLMGGSVRLDESYHSGVGSNPGARFIVDLNTSPVPIESVGMVDFSTSAVVTNDDYRKTSLPESLDILFVDDDMLLRRLFSRSVKKVCPQWVVTEASSGEAALNLAGSHDYDVIFMDQYMTSAEKNLLGTESVRLLRTKGCKSIICGLSANDIEKLFMSAGANAFAMKPFPCKEEPMKQEMTRILRGEILTDNEGMTPSTPDPATAF